MMETISKSEAHLQQLVEKSNQVLFTAHAVFPLQLVPDRVIIDESKITIEYRNILYTETIQTILLQDVSGVEVAYSLFLASAVIKGRKTYVVPFLRIADAIKIKEIITGLQVARREQIDLSRLNPAHLTEKLIEIGKPHPRE